MDPKPPDTGAFDKCAGGAQRQLQRLSLLSRGPPAQAHADQLSARRLLRAPGSLSVLESIASYRSSRVNALILHFLDLSRDNQCVYES